MELWHAVDFQLPPKRSRGRDRRAKEAASPAHTLSWTAALPRVSAKQAACPTAPTLLHDCTASAHRAHSSYAHAHAPYCRRNSYTTPCALNLERLAAWLQRRRTAILRLEVALLYPDAAALLPQVRAAARLSGLVLCVYWRGGRCVVPRFSGASTRRARGVSASVCCIQSPASLWLPQLLPGLEALRTLVLHGNCSDWPYLWLDWRWLAGMQQVW